MKNNVPKVTLPQFDDLFKSEEIRQEERLERILRVPAEEIFPYARQPYSIDRPTAYLAQLMDSIERMGITEPLITRPREDGGYEIISGHRRDYCGRMIGLPDRPIIVRDYTDDEADILVADANIKREDLLPSEKARAYKLKLDAMRRQAGRPEKNSLQIGENFRGTTSVKILAEQVEESATQIQRYIRLNHLIPELLEQVDNGALKFTAAADYISHLTGEEQVELAHIIERDEISPSIGQVQQLKQLSAEGILTNDKMEDILNEEKPLEIKVIIKQDKLKKYFPKGFTPQQMEHVILGLLEDWQKKQLRQRQQNMSR